MDVLGSSLDWVPGQLWQDLPAPSTSIAARPQQLSERIRRERCATIVTLAHSRVPQPTEDAYKAPGVRWLE